MFLRAHIVTGSCVPRLFHYRERCHCAVERATLEKRRVPGAARGHQSPPPHHTIIGEIVTIVIQFNSTFNSTNVELNVLVTASGQRSFDSYGG
eukprot:9187349-Pyramimonas_sp.AAC.1